MRPDNVIRGFTTLFLLFLTAGLFAQSPADWWYFGAEAGIHFTGTGPVADTNGAMTTQEGCASVSSANGDLLFYTDGTWVWDATHQVMPNGDSLLGNASSTQSAVIVPYPGNSSRYYIFTARGCTGGSSTGMPGYVFAYSVVDVTLNGGLGDVLTAQKNIILFDSSSEKCTALPHPNGTDIWVVGREQVDADYHAFHLASSGIVDTVVTTIGSPNLCVGYMLANHAGDQIAVAGYSNNSYVEIYPFDGNTGVLGTPDSISAIGYGVHFSPNDSILYVGGASGLLQYDLTAADITSTEYQVASGALYALAEGPDEKIYVSRYLQPFLARINDPDVLGAGCNFQDTAVLLDGRICRVGLPNHVGASIFAIGVFNYVGVCLGETTLFSVDTTDIDSVKWNFGDPGSGAANQSTAFFPSHYYADTGTYTVTLIAYNDTASDTAIQSIYIYPRQTIDLGPDTSLCDGDTLDLDITQLHANAYLWRGGATGSTVSISSDTTIWATVFGRCDTVSDTLVVQFDQAFTLELGPDTLVCDDPGFFLSTGVTGSADYSWSTGDTTDTIYPPTSDLYIVTVTNGCVEEVDSIQVTFKPVPGDSMLPVDTINCFDNEIVLVSPDLDSVTYIWSDSSTKNTYTVDTTETVWLAAFNECGFSVDTIDIIFNGEILSELGEDTAICEGDSIALVATHPGATYTWNTGEVSDTIWSDQVETFNYVVTVTFKDCQTIESKRVDMDDFYCPPIDCSLQYANTFSPNSDGVNDKFRPWSDCEIYSFSMYIYNRWGQLIHSDNHVQFGWDGFVNGEPAPQGVYFFVIDFNDRVVVDEDRNVYQGSFTLVR